MARFSSVSDVKDPLLRNVSKESDHLEAEKEIERELRRRGIDPEQVDEEFLKDLSVDYACARRALYEVQTENDPWSVRQRAYSESYKMKLRQLDRESATGTVALGGMGAFRSIIVRR